MCVLRAQAKCQGKNLPGSTHISQSDAGSDGLARIMTYGPVGLGTVGPQQIADGIDSLVPRFSSALNIRAGDEKSANLFVHRRRDRYLCRFRVGLVEQARSGWAGPSTGRSSAGDSPSDVAAKVFVDRRKLLEYASQGALVQR